MMEQIQTRQTGARAPGANADETDDERLARAGQLVGYASGRRYRVRGEFLFRGVPLAGARVLEVGCGAGAWAVWAALHGAARVVGIEPEADGSTSDTLAAFRRNVAALGLGDRVEAEGITLEQLPAQERPFDVVVMYNVINHLDEPAVEIMHRDAAAFARFVSILEDLRRRVRPGGWIVVADCTRDNLWPRLGLRSPLAPQIDWEKHQHPRTWIKAFEQAGFETVDLRWSPIQPFVRATSNRLVQYLTASHFVLRFRARATEGDGVNASN